MSGRIAHRPRYRMTRQFVQPPRHSQKEFFRTRWTYRHVAAYEKHPLGYRLSFIPFGYRFVKDLVVRPAGT